MAIVGLTERFEAKAAQYRELVQQQTQLNEEVHRLEGEMRLLQQMYQEENMPQADVETLPVAGPEAEPVVEAQAEPEPEAPVNIDKKRKGRR